MTNYIAKELIEDVIKYTDPLKLIEKRINTINTIDDINLIFSKLEKIKTKKTQEILLSHLIQTYPDLKYFEINNILNNQIFSFELKIEAGLSFTKFSFNSKFILIGDPDLFLLNLARINITERYAFRNLYIRFIDNKYWFYYPMDDNNYSRVSEIKKI